MLILIPFNAYAQVSKNSVYTIESFDKLLNSHINPYLMPTGAAKEAFNVRANNQYGSLVKREKMLELGSCRSAAVKSIHRYYKSDDTKYTLTTASTFLDAIDDDGVCTGLMSGLSDGKKWSWVTYKDIAVGMNGSNLAVKYDGHTLVTDNTDGARTAGDLAAELGAPFAELNTGTNLDASKWYQYKIAYYDGIVYKYSTARSNPILTGSSVRNITLTDIPIGATGTTSRIIYRIEGAASKADAQADTSYFKVASIADNSTLTYNDAITDTTIATNAAPTWSTVSAGTDATPPKGKLSLIHKERLIIANDPSGVIGGKSTVYWSDVLKPDYFIQSSEYELIRPDDGDEVTFIKNLLGILTIGKTNTIQKFYTDAAATANWSLSNPFSFVGNVAMYSAQNTIAGIVYLNRFGLYLFNGQSSELISDVVTAEIRDILETSFDEVEAIYHDNAYSLAYTSKETGVGQNDRVLILDMVRDAYTIDTKSISSFESFDSGTDFGTLYSGSSTVTGKIFAHTGAFNQLVYRYKSELEGGAVDTVVFGGTETAPTMEIGWGVTLDSLSFADVTLDSVSFGGDTIDRPTDPGYWYSPIVEVNAQSLDKLSWNETLGTYGEVIFEIRLASTSGGIASAVFGADYSSPSGSDISGETVNNFLQLRAKMTTTDVTETPRLFVEDSFMIKMTYTKEGGNSETSIVSIWSSGYQNFDGSMNPKRIKEVQIYYEGTAGTLNFAYDNVQGNASGNFDIDLSIDPATDASDDYFGTSVENIYRYVPSFLETPTGRYWQYTVTETGTEEWKIKRIVTIYDTQDYISF